MAVPYCLAMVICDAVHRDPGTSKFTILGTFGNLTATSYPADIQFVVYFAITDGRGPIKITLQLVNAAVEPIHASVEGAVDGRVFKVSQDAEIPNPVAVLEGAFGVKVTIPDAGIYHCELWANNELLMSRRITAIRLQKNTTEGE